MVHSPLQKVSKEGGGGGHGNWEGWHATARKRMSVTYQPLFSQVSILSVPPLATYSESVLMMTLLNGP